MYREAEVEEEAQQRKPEKLVQCPCPTTASEADGAGWKEVQIFPDAERSLEHF